MQNTMVRIPQGVPQMLSHAVIITGIRRCGKSTVLQQMMSVTEEPSIFINFEDPRLIGFDLGDLNRLNEIAEETGVKVYYFDEIQSVTNWENFVRFRLDEGYRVFITGSNASMLSKELGTKLTGRHVLRELFPFSYSEYLRFMNRSASPESASDYMQTGGFPEYLKTGLSEILEQSFNDIIIKDIAVRYNIRNTITLRQMALWLVSNTGKKTSGNSLGKALQIASSSTVMEYLSCFSDTYMFFLIPRFSHSLKVQAVNHKKIYCIDNGFITTNSMSFSEDKGRLLENMVMMELRRESSEIYYFSEKYECDFVVFKNNKLQSLIQVCLQIDESNLAREVAGLTEAMQFFGKDHGIIVTAAQADTFIIEQKTITVLPFHTWATAPPLLQTEPVSRN